MKPRARQSSEGGAGAPAPAQDRPDGGESVCYLPLVDENGTLNEPRHLVREYEPGARRVVDLSPGSPSKDHSAPELVPLPGESVADYQRRLQRPVERTAAWKLALAAPIAIRLDGDEFETHRQAIVEYIRTLVT